MAPLLLRNSINNDSTSHRKWSRLLFIHGCGRKMDLFIFNGDAITRLKNQSIGGGAVSGGPRNEIYWNQLNTMNDGALKKKKKEKERVSNRFVAYSLCRIIIITVDEFNLSHDEQRKIYIERNIYHKKKIRLN